MEDKVITLQSGRKIYVDELLKIKFYRGLSESRLAKKLKLTLTELEEIVEVMRRDYPTQYYTYHRNTSTCTRKVDFDEIIKYMNTGPKTRQEIITHFKIGDRTLSDYLREAKESRPEVYEEYLELINKQKKQVVSQSLKIIKSKKDIAQKINSGQTKGVTKSSIKPEEAIRILKQVAKQYQEKERDEI